MNTVSASEGRSDRKMSICQFVTVIASGVVAQAQQPTKIPRIGFLAAGAALSASTRLEAFRQGLRELGYVEGKDIVIE